MDHKKKVILAILDGWGLGVDKKSDAIKNASVPFFDSLMSNYTNATLQTFGESVGLPNGQMGNSEVGHLNLGAGRVVYQELHKINLSIQNKELENSAVLEEAICFSKDHKSTFHLMGLLSDGGVHSHIDHLLYILECLKNKNVQNVVIHVVTDGRDTDPKSGLLFINRLQSVVDNYNFKIASVSGRYYAMDRDKRWERVKLFYDCLVYGKGDFAEKASDVTINNYAIGITDEFIKPTLIKYPDDIHLVKDKDVVFCFNFRTDRFREITQFFTQSGFKDLGVEPKDLFYITITEYDKLFKNVKVIFRTDDLKNTLGEILEKNNKKQIRIAETEKYPHVTFFFQWR